MAPKKGEFPARPPTLAEALYGNTEIETTLANGNSNSKDLNLGALENTKKEKATVVEKKEQKIQKNLKPVKSIVAQQEASLSQPLPQEASSDLINGFVLPTQSEAITNLQMDYLLQRKSLLIRYIASTRTFTSVVTVIVGVLGYWKLNGYMSDYLFKDGYFQAVKSLFNNSYFLDDFSHLVLYLVLLVTSFFMFAKMQSGFLQFESEDVPKNFQNYFNIDMSDYATVKHPDNFKKLNKDEKEMVKFMKEYSVCLNYRDHAVAFMIDRPKDKVENEKIPSFEIIGYGIRRVYVKAGMFKDLLGLTLRNLVQKHQDFNVSIKIYNFEEADISVLRKAGFVKSGSEKLGLLTLLFGVTKDTYVLETDNVEF